MNKLENILIDDFSILITKLKIDKKLFKHNNYKIIHFTPPDVQSGKLHPDTKHKFIKLFSLPLPKGIFGPFYRYTPNDDFLIADNDIGGYFTIKKINCFGCAKRDFWLYDKNRKYFYEKNNSLNRFECFFEINDDTYSTIFIGNISYGDAIQVRPNNWIFGGDTYSKNKVYYKFQKKLLDPNLINCNKCTKSFFEFFK